VGDTADVQGGKKEKLQSRGLPDTLQHGEDGGEEGFKDLLGGRGARKRNPEGGTFRRRAGKNVSDKWPEGLQEGKGRGAKGKVRCLQRIRGRWVSLFALAAESPKE